MIKISAQLNKNIWITSDLHFNHNREFIFKPRGFENIHDMNETIINNYNFVVNPDDDVYILGDLMLGDNELGKKCLERLNGRIHIVYGNHDTDARKEIYQNLNNVVECCYATMIKYAGYHFYLSHFPTLTANLEKESLKQCTINLFGHTHSKDNFYNDIPFMYNVAVDAHNCYPILLDNIIEDAIKKVAECKKYL